MNLISWCLLNFLVNFLFLVFGVFKRFLYSQFSILTSLVDVLGSSSRRGQPSLESPTLREFELLLSPHLVHFDIIRTRLFYFSGTHTYCLSSWLTCHFQLGSFPNIKKIWKKNSIFYIKWLYLIFFTVFKIQVIFLE